MPASENTEAKKKKTKKRSKKKGGGAAVPIIVTCCALVALASGAVGVYYYGKAKYEDKFLPNTYINGVDVSGLTLDEAKKLFVRTDLPEKLVIHKRDNTDIVISPADFGYGYDTEQQIEDIFNRIDRSTWFMSYAGDSTYSYVDTISYDEEELKYLLSGSDWGSLENADAVIELTDEGYVINPAVQGDNMEYSALEEFILKAVRNGDFEMNAVDSDCYIAPTIQEADLQEQCDRLNKIFTMEITYDFDYTTETLTGDQLLDMITINDDYSITADRDKAMAYVEYLAEKYDTYNTKRKFHATIQGDIVVPTSADAKYGWWLWQDPTCDELVEMLEKGESVESVDPIYYETGGYVFTGREDARSADDDIGDTYIEIDLTNQHCWYYEKGELKYESDIVSGQTTSEARTTLPGVYKVWYKATNYRMKDSNADGDEWDVTCDYWTRVAIVGIGLHDSQWRGSAFGGSIYKWNGSHGCINMPLAAAKFVYEEVEMDTPVVMYY